jgi:hypothetical protein
MTDPYLTGNRHVDAATNSIDAAVFNGDVFLDDDARIAIRGLMARWEVKLKEWDELSAFLKEEASRQVFHVYFFGLTGEALKILTVDRAEVEGLTAPIDTLRFELLTDDDMERVGPIYFVTDEVDFGSLQELRTSYPSAICLEPGSEAENYGLVSNLDAGAKFLVPCAANSAFYWRDGRIAVRPPTRPDSENGNRTARSGA